MSHKKKGGRSLTKLALFEERDKMHPRNETYEGLENFTGLVPKRSKTDLFFLIVYLLCIIAVLILFYFAFSTHDFYRLGRGFDFRGDICGKVNTTVADKPYLYYEDPLKIGDTGMCVDRCPTRIGQEMCFYDVDGQTLLDDYCYFSYATTPIGKYCYPAEMGTNRTLIEGYTKTPSQLLKIVAGDLYMVYDVFLVALIITGGLGLIFIVGFLCDLTRKLTLWICVLGSGGLGGFLAVLFILDYRKIVEKECPLGIDENGCTGIKSFLLITLAILTIVTMVGFYIYIFKNRDKIKFVLKRSSADVLLKPIREVKTMILFLVCQYALQFIVVAFFFFASVVLLASGQLTLMLKKTVSDFPNYRYFEIRQPSYVYVALALFILVFLWTMGNLLLFGRMIITSAVSTWYFSREKSILDLPIFRGIKYTLRFHIGSIAYGAVCVALNWPFKSFFGIIKNRLKKIRNRKSRTFKFWMSSCSLALAAYELVLKYVSNKNLMQTAIFGEEFCVGGVRVFYLKYRNESRLKLLKNTIGYYLILGKIFISLAVTIISYNLLLFNQKSPFGQDLSYLQFAYVPALLIFVVTLFVSQTFTSLFDLVIDAIFFCFICDEEMYTGKQRYAEQELREFMDQYGKEAKKQDDEMDVRARPKQFKGEDENSLIEDNIFVTEQHKSPSPSPTPDDKNRDKGKLVGQKDDHEHEDETQAYKVLNVDDAVSAVSDHADHAVSVSDVTSRWQPPAKEEEEKKGDDFGFQVLNFGSLNKKEGSEDEDEEDDDDNEDNENGGGKQGESHLQGFAIKDIKKNINSRANRRKQRGNNEEEDENEDEDEDGEGDEDEEEEEEGGQPKSSRRRPKDADDDDDDEEDEEDLEQAEDQDNPNSKKKNAVKKNVSSKVDNKGSSRLDALYKLRTLNTIKQNEKSTEDKKKFIF